MNLLTQSDVNAMAKEERINALDYWQDEACNIDYLVNPLESDIINRNVSILESKILHNEY